MNNRVWRKIVTFSIAGCMLSVTGISTLLSHGTTVAQAETALVIDEDFSADATNFTVVRGGDWSVADGRYVLYSAANATPLGNISVHNVAVDGDFTLTALGSVKDRSAYDDFAFVFDYQDESNYYYASFNEYNDASTHGIFKVENGTKTELADFGTLIQGNTDYNIVITRSAGTISVVVDAAVWASAPDESVLPPGKVGFGSINNDSAFDTLQVAALTSSNGNGNSPNKPDPEDRYPGFATPEGHFLHYQSYPGYPHRCLGHTPMKTNSSPDSESEPAQPHEEAASTGETWRSSLYPENWYPGYKNADGHFVHDWSYAGYRQGEQDIPDTVPGCVFDVTHPHYGADPAGENDSTASIQRAISDAGHAGGGTVYLPAGTYKISLERSKDPSDAVLFIEHSGVVLRGAGVGETRLLNTTSAGMRFKDVIQVAPESGPHWAVTDRNQRNNTIYWETKRLLTQDVPEMSTVIHVDDVSGYQVGDDIFIGFELTDAWIAEHGLTGVWDSANMTTYGVADETGGMFSRTITAIDPANDTIAIDIPTRYRLKTRDRAMVWKHQLPFIREVGIEDISMGSAIEGGTTTSIGSGTYGYNIMNAHNITFQYVKDGWVRRVESYNAGNPHGLELLSNGIKLNMSRNVTVQDTTFRNAQHLGDGGNGYLYTLSGNDNLLERATAIGGRHNYTFGRFFSTGNVIFNSVGQDSAHGPSDFHMFLSAANLIDSMRFDGDYFEAMYRPWGDPIHGHTSSQTAFWNTYGESYFRDRPFIIDSRQYGYGYVVGTSGPASAIQTTPTDGWWEWHTDTAPEDIAEGEGLGETLAPQSLYLDQKARRLGN